MVWKVMLLGVLKRVNTWDILGLEGDDECLVSVNLFYLVARVDWNGKG